MGRNLNNGRGRLCYFLMKKERRKRSKKIFVEGISSVGQRLILALGSTGFSEKSLSFYFVSTDGRLVDI